MARPKKVAQTEELPEAEASNEFETVAEIVENESLFCQTVSQYFQN